MATSAVSVSFTLASALDSNAQIHEVVNSDGSVVVSFARHQRIPFWVDQNLPEQDPLDITTAMPQRYFFDHSYTMVTDIRERMLLPNDIRPVYTGTLPFKTSQKYKNIIPEKSGHRRFYLYVEPKDGSNGKVAMVNNWGERD
jgi:hypothetical protein